MTDLLSFSVMEEKMQSRDMASSLAWRPHQDGQPRPGLHAESGSVEIFARECESGGSSGESGCKRKSRSKEESRLKAVLSPPTFDDVQPSWARKQSKPRAVPEIDAPLAEEDLLPSPDGALAVEHHSAQSQASRDSGSPDHSVPRFEEALMSPILEASTLTARRETLGSPGGAGKLKGRPSSRSTDCDLLSELQPSGRALVPERASSPKGRGFSLGVELSLACIRGHTRGASDVIGTLDFDEAGAMFATGGIARKIRIYSLARLQEAKAAQECGVGLSGDCLSGGSFWLEDWDCEDDAGSPTRERNGGAALREAYFLKKQRCMSQDDASHHLHGGEGAASFLIHGQESPFSQRRKQKASSTNDLAALGREPQLGWQQQPALGGPGNATLDSDRAASKVICTAAKLSSLQWAPQRKGLIGCGDYDGVFTEWDIETGLCVGERDEHSGLKVWSMRYSPVPGSGLSATASEDGTVKLWCSSGESSIAAIPTCPGSALCSVDFSQDGTLLCMGGADASVYVYDLRMLRLSLAVLEGHQRTVSYTRFLNPLTVVSSSIDSTVKVWDLTSLAAPPPSSSNCGAATRMRRPNAVLTTPSSSGCAHVNRRNFVGLAVHPDGIIATGSETNEMVGYRYSSGAQLAPEFRLQFGSGVCSSGGLAACASQSAADLGGGTHVQPVPFVSAVSWQLGSDGQYLAAANSEGLVRIMRAVPA